MRTEMTAGKRLDSATERGAVLVLALLMMFIGTVLALSLLFVTENEMKTSTSFDDHQKALMAADAGVQEALWRLRMINNATAPPPGGSQVTGKGLGALSDNAYINPDRHNTVGVLQKVGIFNKWKGNGINDDTANDATTDELDELESWRDWKVQLLYDYTYVDTDQTKDDNTNDVTVRGDKLILPAVYSADDLVPVASQSTAGKMFYTTDKAAWTANANDPDILTIRFLKESDFGQDFDADGNTDELVYYDHQLLGDGVNNGQSIANGGDSADNESPYNIAFNGRAVSPTGYPVILIQSTGRVMRAGDVVAKRRVEVRYSYEAVRLGKAAICSCNDLVIQGNSQYHSYDSLQGLPGSAKCLTTIGPYSKWSPDPKSTAPNCVRNSTNSASILTNGILSTKGNSLTVYGSVEAYGGFGETNGSVTGTARTKPASQCPVTAWAVGGCTDNIGYMTKPCKCIDIVKLVNSKETANDNNLIKPSADKMYDVDWQTANPNCDGTKMTPAKSATSPDHSAKGLWWFQGGGHYWFDSWSLSGNARVVGGPAGTDPGSKGGACMSVRPDPDSPINIYIKTGYNLTSGGEETFSLLRPAEYILWYSGTQDYDFGPGTFYTNLYGPRATIDFSGNAVIVGVLNVKQNSDQMNGTADFFYDRNVDNSMQGTDAPKIISWREIE